MAKLTKRFQFSYPLTQKVVRDLKIVSEHIGDLLIEGIAYCDTSVSPFVEEESRYTADVETIKWNGQDIKPVLETLDVIEDILIAADRHSEYVFNNRKTVAA